MFRKFIVFYFFLISFYNTSHSQEVQRATITYTPGKNGYILNIPFSWKFIDCFSEVHITITKNKSEITSSAYLYNGKTYTAAEIGADAFVKPEIGLTNISGDIFTGSYKVGTIKMGNVIDWLGGCFGQTYHFPAMLGIPDADFKNKLSTLSLRNIKIEEASSVSLSVENKIKEIEKQSTLKDIFSRADRAFNSNNFEEAKSLYEEALRIDYTNQYAKAKLEEIKKKQQEKKQENDFKKHKEVAESLERNGDLEGAKAEYEVASGLNPDDESVKRKIRDLNEKINQKKQEASKKQETINAASSRRHKGMFWGKNFGSDSHGSSTQAANLIGNFRIDYDMWSLVGEPAYKFRFYWEWENSLNTGYPQWVTVLSDTVVMVADLKKYPDLMEKWNRIKPLYIEVKSDVLSYKNGDDHVASKGTISIIPEIIGYSGQETEWSQPSSSSWEELFPYCNYLNWDFFRNVGIYDEISEYDKKFGNKIAWAKYTFEYSDNINFYQSFQSFSSNFKQLNREDYYNYSSSADIVKVVWPVEEIQSVIKEFLDREKREKEEKMSIEDFWNTPESEQKSASRGFWDTPENTLTQNERQEQQLAGEAGKLISQLSELVKTRREKYKALQNPFNISSPANNSVVDKNVINVDGKINEYFLRNTNEVYLNLNGVRQQINVNSNGSFSNPMVLSNGENEIQLELKGKGFTIQAPLKVIYNGVDTDIRVTLTWNTGNSDLDLLVRNPNGTSCNYQNRNTGGMSLDVDDTNGYGPENISVVNGQSGTYDISVTNYSRGEGTEATVYIYVNEQLKEIKKHTFYRNKEVWNVGSVRLN